MKNNQGSLLLIIKICSDDGITPESKELILLSRDAGKDQLEQYLRWSRWIGYKWMLISRSTRFIAHEVPAPIFHW